MTKKSYIAKKAILHDGEPYAEGESIDLDEKTEAPQLIAVGAIEPAAEAIEPATEAIKPAAETTEPAAETTEPEAETIETATKPKKSAAKA